MLIDVAMSGDRNVIKKEAEKILKYKDLTVEIQRMWNVKTKVIPVIIGATGTVSKSMWNKKPTRCHLVLYLFLLYKLLNMFRANLCLSSGAQLLKMGTR